MNNYYLLHGDDDYLIDKNIKKITKDSETIYYDLEENNLKNLVEELLMPSLFSNKKTVVGINSNFFSSVKSKQEHNIDDFLNFLEIETEHTLILICQKKLDARKKITKIAHEKFKIISCQGLEGEQLIKTVKSMFQEQGLKINNLLINEFLAKTGNNLYNINNEINKLSLYKEDKEVSSKDISLITSKVFLVDIFDLINALIKHNQIEALEIYEELLLYNEEPIKIIIMLANEYRLIFQVKHMLKQGLGQNEISNKLNIHPYRIKLASEKSYLFSFNKLMEILTSLGNLDKGIKSGNLNKDIAFEMFILNL